MDLIEIGRKIGKVAGVILIWMIIGFLAFSCGPISAIIISIIAVFKIRKLIKKH